MVVACGALLLFFLWTTTNLQVMHSQWFPPQLAITRHTFHILNLPPALENARLVVLSDIHFSSHNTHISPAFLESVVAAVNAEEPALVLIVGDVVNNDPGAASLVGQILTHLQPTAGPHGVLVSLGNHDDPSIVGTLRELGLTVLINEVVYPLGPGLALVGLGDAELGNFNPAAVLGGLPAEEPRIVMSHHPDTAYALRQWRVDLQVAGHTHATQIALPGVGALLPLLHHIKAFLPRWLHERIPAFAYTEVMQHWDLVYGRHCVECKHDPIPHELVVTAGVGTTPPFRLAIPPEVVVLTLRRDPGEYIVFHNGVPHKVY